MSLQGLLLVGGVGMFIAGLLTSWRLIHFWDAPLWPTQPVVIEISELNYPDTTDRGCAQPHIEYSYQFGGKPQRSEFWGFSIQTCGEPAWARSIIDRFPRGSHDAHVDPETGRAVLDPDVSALWIMTLAGPLCILGFVLVRRIPLE